MAPIKPRALIFAAGFGRRLLPLTEKIPKPLIEVGGKSLIQYHIENLAGTGVTDLVINTHWLAAELVKELGDGGACGVNIQWSREPEILDTGGGMKNALPLLGEQPFLVVNADIWTDFPLATLFQKQIHHSGAYLVMVPNPDWHGCGDFSLKDGKLVVDADVPKYTYAGIGLYSPQFILDYCGAEKRFPLREPLNAAIASGRVTAGLHGGEWYDIGTPERLHALQKRLASSE